MVIMDTYENEYNLKNEDNPKKEENRKNEDDLKMALNPKKKT